MHVSSTWRPVLAGALVAGATAILVWLFHDLRLDDAYITYRYGQNLATGHGLVFNPGERVLGTTAPGHAVLAALVHVIVGPELLPAVMCGLGVVGWMAQAVAVFFLFRGLLGGVVAFLVAACVAAGATQAYLWVSMETNVVAALAMWAMVAAVAGRWMIVALLVGVAGFVRPDAYLLALPVGVAWLRAGEWRRLRPAAIFAALVAANAAFLLVTVGTILPRTFHAKVGKTPFTVYLRGLGDVVAGSFADQSGAMAVAAVLLLAVVGAVWVSRAAPRLWILPAYGLLHAGVYAALGPELSFGWHFYPANLTAVTLALVGIGAAARWLRQRSRMIHAAMIAVPLPLLAAVYVPRTIAFVDLGRKEYFWGARDRVYAAVAGFLVQHAAPGDRVSSMEVGTIAYYARLEMHDASGLVTARFPVPRDVRWIVVARHHTMGGRERLLAALRRSRDRWAIRAELQSGEFQAWIVSPE